MGKKILLTILLQILASATLFADGTNCAISSSVETNGCRFTVCAMNAAIKIGDMIAIKTTLENISTNEVTVFFASPLHTFKIDVLRDQSEIVPITLYGGGLRRNEMSIAQRTLGPGEQVAESLLINRLFDMSNVGDYQITVSRWVRTQNKTDWSAAIAPPLKITLTKQ